MTITALPTEFQAYLRDQHPHPLALHRKMILALDCFYLLFCAICFVGLFLLKPFSRKLFVVLILGGVLLDPFLTLSVKSGWDACVEDCSNLLLVGVFILIYFSSLKDNFVKKL